MREVIAARLRLQPFVFSSQSATGRRVYSPPEGDTVDDEAVLLEVDAHTQQVSAERPGEGPLLGHLLGLVDHLPIEESFFLATHKRVHQGHLFVLEGEGTEAA